MRLPISGNLPTLPVLDYGYSSRIQYSQGKTQFEHVYSGAYGDTYFDVGLERPVLFSCASSGSGVAYAWSPYTAKASSDDIANADKLRIGYKNTNSGSVSDTVSSVSITRLSRPGVVYTGTEFLVGYVAGGNVVVRTLTTTPGLGTVHINAAHGIPTGAIAVSVISRTEVWLTYTVSGIHYAKRYSGGSWSSHAISADADLRDWHTTGSRVVKNGSDYVVVYQSTPGGPSCRIFRNNRFSERYNVIGADTEYAFQWAMVTSLDIINGRLVATMTRAIQNMDNELTGFFSSVMISEDGQIWSDWATITAGHFRGGIGNIDNRTIAMTVNQFYSSLGTETLGNATWHDIDEVTGWSLDFRADAATMGNTLVYMNSNTYMPAAGDIIRRYITVNGVEFLYSTESCDTVPSSKRSTGMTGAITSRGLLKNGIQYVSTVDELFSGGKMRLSDFRLHGIVSKKGTWTHHEEERFMQSSIDNGVAVAILPESVDNSFWYVSTAMSRKDGAGPIIFFENEDNYWHIYWSQGDNKYIVSRVVAGTATTLAQFNPLAGEDSAWLCRYVPGQLYIYVSTPSVASKASNKLTNLQWTLLWSMSVPVHPKSFYVGFGGPTGTQWSGVFLRSMDIENTIGTVAKAVGAMASMNVQVKDQINLYPDYVLASGIFLEDVKLDGYDLNLTTNMSGTQYLRVYFGGPRSTQSTVIDPSEWPYMVTITTGSVSLHGHNGTLWTTYASMPLVYPIQVDDDIRVRLSRSDDLTYSTLSVYVNRELVWSTPSPSHMDRGYLAIDGTCSIKNLFVDGLSHPVYDHIWQYNRSAADEIRSMTSAFFWSMYEQPDGTILLAPAETVGTSSVNLDSTTEVVNNVPEDEWYSVYKVVGAEVFGVYVDEELIKRGVRPYETDSPHLYDEESCLHQAYRRALYMRSLANKKTMSGFLDPRLEVNDQVLSDGELCAVVDINVSISNPREPMARMNYTLRKL